MRGVGEQEPDGARTGRLLAVRCERLVEAGAGCCIPWRRSDPGDHRVKTAACAQEGQRGPVVAHTSEEAGATFSRAGRPGWGALLGWSVALVPHRGGCIAARPQSMVAAPEPSAQRRRVNRVIESGRKHAYLRSHHGERPHSSCDV
jgi:hypothetical protein